VTIVLAPTEQRVFEQVSVARNAHIEKETGESSSSSSSSSVERKQNRRKTVETLIVSSVRYSIYVAFAFFPFLSSLGSQIVYFTMGEKWIQTKAALLETIFLMSIALMSVNGVVEFDFF
jgi:hypothetical protein